MALTKWTLDPTHAEIQFKVRHLMIPTVKVSFGNSVSLKLRTIIWKLQSNFRRKWIPSPPITNNVTRT
jgi:hypothetical protein